MTTKKYKTVSGYLRSEDERMNCRIPYGSSDDQRIAAVKAGQRDILNRLLPQLGLPQLDANETPFDGIERLLAIGGTDQQLKALKDCQRWLKNYRLVLSVSVVPQVKTEQGLVSYHVRGFRRDDHSTVNLIVDADELGSPFKAAEAIAGPDYCLPTCCNINHPVPDAAKNRLFTSDEELFAAVPEMDWRRSRARRVTR